MQLLRNYIRYKINIDKLVKRGIYVPHRCGDDRILALTKDEDYLQNSQKQAQVKTLEREIDEMVY
ncbi:MAG: hypothetical protein Q8K98_13690 [Bacteroidota bacterium]|nr:hypothetical protein [Bacteroidota bacterium]